MPRGFTIPKDRPPAALIRVTAVLPGDVVRVSAKAKETRIVTKDRKPGQVVLKFSNDDVRTYGEDDRIILIWRPEESNL